MFGQEMKSSQYWNAKVAFVKPVFAEPHSSVSHVQKLITGGRWFDPRLGQNSSRGLMIVIATGFILLSPLSMFRQWLCGIGARGLERILCGALIKKYQESMDRCTGRREITVILLKTVLKNHTTNHF